MKKLEAEGKKEEAAAIEAARIAYDEEVAANQKAKEE